MHVEPVSAYPPASSRTLAQWLAPELTAEHGAESRTRLREIAEARAMRRGMWSSLLALGASSVALGLVLLIVGVTPGGWVPCLVAGALVAVVCAAFLRRERGWIPAPGTALATRGVGTLGGGLIAASSLFLASNILLMPAIMSSFDPVPLVVWDVGLALVLVSVFVIPGAIIGRGREALRRSVLTDPRLAAELERERETWVAQISVPMFGPL
nr:hypothetical protein [Microbacterium hydrocarbonoxydans]